ncbi:hypothetical protein TNCV_115041 [Trichonephila clavipes]|nr:hypothetical protein TNCV_115041 [Trichonephila clavipes]
MHGPFIFRNRQTAMVFKVDIVKSIPSERRLRRIVRIQRSQTLAYIITQLNDDASRTVNGLCNARFTGWVSGAVDLQEYQ